MFSLQWISCSKLSEAIWALPVKHWERLGGLVIPFLECYKKKLDGNWSGTGRFNPSLDMSVGLDEFLAFSPAFPCSAWPLSLRSWRALEAGLTEEESPSRLYRLCWLICCHYSVFCLLSLSLFQYSFLSGTVSSQCGSVSQVRLPERLSKSAWYISPYWICANAQIQQHTELGNRLLINLTNIFCYRVLLSLVYNVNSFNCLGLNFTYRVFASNWIIYGNFSQNDIVFLRRSLEKYIVCFIVFFFFFSNLLFGKP